MSVRLFTLQAISSLHVGAGRGEGYIDLPLTREKVSGFPYVPGSSVKGVFADSCDANEERRDPNNQNYNAILRAAFGRAGEDNANAGALVFSDARLVCFPVRSLYGTFAWCTSPYVLQRLERDVAMASISGWPAAPASTITGARFCTDWPTETGQVLKSLIHREGSVYLEDIDISASADADTLAWARKIAEIVFPGDADWTREFFHRFLILPDDTFNFLTQTATEVQPHIRIDQDFKRTVSGALWYEESLPAESLMIGTVWCDKTYTQDSTTTVQVQGLLNNKFLQMGGKATVGKGRVKLSFSN